MSARATDARASSHRPGVRGARQASTTTFFPETVALASSSGLVAGCLSTNPSLIENRLPWQVQTMASPRISDTGQPWWVQMLLNASNSPSVGWVTTYLASSRMTPPPTGTSAVATLGPDGAAGADDEADGDGDADADGEGGADEEAEAEGAALLTAGGAATWASAE